MVLLYKRRQHFWKKLELHLLSIWNERGYHAHVLADLLINSFRHDYIQSILYNIWCDIYTKVPGFSLPILIKLSILTQSKVPLWELYNQAASLLHACSASNHSEWADQSLCDHQLISCLHFHLVGPCTQFRHTCSHYLLYPLGIRGTLIIFVFVVSHFHFCGSYLSWHYFVSYSNLKFRNYLSNTLSCRCIKQHFEWSVSTFRSPKLDCIILNIDVLVEFFLSDFLDFKLINPLYVS